MGKCGCGGKQQNGCFLSSLKYCQLQGNPLSIEAEPLCEGRGGAEAKSVESEAERPRACKSNCIQSLHTETPPLRSPWLKTPSNPASVSHKTPHNPTSGEHIFTSKTFSAIFQNEAH